ncbi:uncharacterized protein LOC106718424 [Papilio machaon]|uniref:uncharacterized protein LOC106718424 n=1 Tax=Papilio machaon TaxID=76193 RepID=UPI001E663604|nr:uncharacterized protein LOC106718424 [Papilio machaon]
MNRDFIYNYQDDGPNTWSRIGSTLNKWLWGALCCGIPGVPCYFCTCCKQLDTMTERERPRVNQATGTTERLSRQHRPNAPRSRKATPETLSAVRCALSQLQGEPAPVPPFPLPAEHRTQDPG